MKAFVETTLLKVRIAFPGFNHHLDGNLIVGFFLHHLVMQDKAVGVFNNANTQP